MARIIDGKATAKKVRGELKVRTQALAERGVTPGLAVVLVGDDPASAIYVRSKTRMARRVGIQTCDHRLDTSTSQAALLELVAQLNADPAVDGVLVQLPLPSQIDESAVIEAIAPEKDVDGFHPTTVGRLLAGEPTYVPCTPAGVMRLLDETGVELQGAKALVVGRSNIVGKPMAQLLLARHCTVTIAHSKTRELAKEVSQADVVVAAVGRPELIKGEWIKPGAVVIDVGTNRVDDQLIGDVAFTAAAERAEAITPVPGGVGPMTIAMLLANTVTSAERRSGS
ncbi:MAG: bifunctional methylenetetrahydrofolate dehydrogenase/methenyltetrahydrofolate cyclohydrolase FolD [Proteobacteria bacterium]|nr:MAG: bifunctional methylenetetrahydrofolate dehydrogenase/methenyltetrahydrofolate cyclohydrolase FolD [Pseudomonadota bacterium]PIE19132.1 MAG: bifunctional methylenetetrahydrofolate dehydrogenase/methenyltetrahydrofolate cyclohydrolase FolD [Pseudomonadota bacterium]